MEWKRRFGCRVLFLITFLLSKVAFDVENHFLLEEKENQHQMAVHTLEVNLSEYEIH